MRAIWKGYIRFNLVMIPIKVFRATQPKALQFHNLHRTGHSRLLIQKYCPKYNTAVGHFRAPVFLEIIRER